MAKKFRDWNLEQQVMFPPCASDLMPEGHLVHLVRNVVMDELDLAKFVDSYGEERGYPPYSPVMMTALLRYGNAVGIYSSRRMARAGEERVDFMALTGCRSRTSGPSAYFASAFRGAEGII
jgi:transposase